MTIKTTITVSALEAVSLFVDKKSGLLRWRTDGIFCDVLPGETRLVATDGYCLAIYRFPQENEITGSAIIPVDVIKYFKKWKGAVVDLVIKDRRLTFIHSGHEEEVQFASIEGRFPEYGSILPMIESEAKNTYYNPTALLRFEKAAKILMSRDKDLNFYSLCKLYPNGDNAVVEMLGDDNFTGMVMSYKLTEEYKEKKLNTWWKLG